MTNIKFQRAALAANQAMLADLLNGYEDMAEGAFCTRCDFDTGNQVIGAWVTDSGVKLCWECVYVMDHYYTSLITAREEVIEKALAARTFAGIILAFLAGAMIDTWIAAW